MLTGYLARPVRLAGIVLLSVALLALCVACGLEPAEPTVTPVLMVTPLPTAVPVVAWAQPGCAEALDGPGNDLPFASVVDGSRSVPILNRGPGEPSLFLLDSPSDLQQIEPYLSRARLENEITFDFGQSYYVVVTDAQQGDLCRGIAVERVWHTGTELVVCVRAWGARAHQVCEKVMHYPYDIVEVKRDGLVPQNMTLSLCRRPGVSPRATAALPTVAP